MRKVSVSVFILLTICCGPAYKLFAQVSEKDHMIFTELQKDTYVFGNALQMNIKYKNTGKNDWTLRMPDNSLDVLLYYAPVTGIKNPGSCWMGKKQTITITDTDGSEITAFIDSEPQYIKIGAGEEYSFMKDIYEPWSGLIFPGKWVIWAEDINEKLKSETVEFRIVFTNESVQLLLNIAKNTEEHVSKRKWHTKYLHELKTDMPELRWPCYDDSPEEKSRKEALIQKHLKEFEDFWNKEKNSATVQKTIERINSVCCEITESSSRKNCPDILEFRR